MSDQPVFYFDFLSPYAYLAAERIGELMPDADWRPFPYPFLLHELGRLEEAMKRDPRPRLAETAERASARGLPPVNPPPEWPGEAWSLAPLRAAAWADEHGKLKEFSLAAFRKVFVEGRALSEVGNVAAAAAAAGLDGEATAEAIGRPEIKQRVKDNLADARARGVSGIPTVAVGDQLFWGDDRLEDAARARSA